VFCFLPLDISKKSRLGEAAQRYGSGAAAGWVRNHDHYRATAENALHTFSGAAAVACSRCWAAYVSRTLSSMQFDSSLSALILASFETSLNLRMLLISSDKCSKSGNRLEGRIPACLSCALRVSFAEIGISYFTRSHLKNG
jgi:hypothetical protein